MKPVNTTHGEVEVIDSEIVFLLSFAFTDHDCFTRAASVSHGLAWLSVDLSHFRHQQELSPTSRFLAPPRTYTEDISTSRTTHHGYPCRHD